MSLQKYLAVLILIISLCIVSQSFGQNNTQDTIQQFNKEEFRDSLQKLEPKEFARFFTQQYEKDSIKTAISIKNIRKNMLRSEDLVTQFWGYYCLAKWENYKTNFEVSIIQIKKATEIAKEIDNPDLLLSTYVLQGNLYYDYGKYKESMENLLKAIKFAKVIDHIGRQLAISQSIALLKIEVGDNKGAIDLLEGTLRILEEEHIGKFKVLRVSLYIALTKSCMRAEEYEKAERYGNNGIELSNRYGDDDAKAYLYNYLAEINIAKEDYEKATKLIDRSWKIAHKVESAQSQLPFINLNRAKIYFHRKNYRRVITILEKIEFSQEEKNTSFFSLEDMYELLGKAYKAIGNIEKSLFYFEKTNEVYTQNDKQQNAIGIEIIKKYDLQSLKEELSKAEKTSEKTKIILYLSSSLAIVVVVGLIFFYKRREKSNQHKFEAILKSLEKEKIAEKFSEVERIVPKEVPEIKAVEAKEADKKEVEIIDETKVRLLKKLQNFEEKQLYLNKNSSLNVVAKKLKTNTSYLSKLVNAHKGKSFTAYITELRVNYAIRRLKEDKKFRSYTIDSIAQEIGFNRSESFSRAFKNKTGLYPSYYIKNLDNQGVM